MGRYLDGLTAQFDEITEGIEETLNRAADEGREVTTEEAALVERESARAEELKKSIDHYAAIEVTRGKVAETRSKVPAGPQRITAGVTYEREKPVEEVLREAFPTVGDYMATVGRALQGHKAAAEKIEEISRATAHQTLADNPGIVPRPILQPVIDLIDPQRPFVRSISNRPLIAGSFDRPKITQHVAVGKQVAEKDPTSSQKLILGKLPVTADTLAGHVNISRQDIKWTQPGILQIIAEDFANVYAVESDEDAVTKFLASIAANVAVPITAWDAEEIRGLLFQAAAVPFATGEGLAFPDTFWMSLDVWGSLGGITTSLGVPAFPGLAPGVLGGDIAGFKAVVDPFFPAGTAVVGKGAVVEYYEDIDGLVQVAEPDVLGQLVGYAGFEALLNTAPATFTKFSVPVAPPLAAEPATPAKK